MRNRSKLRGLVGLAIAVAAVALSGASPAIAQLSVSNATEASGTGEPEIVVIGLKDPFALSRAQLNELLKAFYEKRGIYAPQAKLYVEIKDLGEGTPRGAQFVLRGKANDIALPADTAGRIYFPDSAPSGGPFDLSSNVARPRTGIAFWVMSPGSTPADRTMGDLRLQCEVMWAAAKSNVSPFVRGLFGAAGACHSSRIAFYFRSAVPLSSGTVVAGHRTMPITVGRNRLAYRAPIWDKSIANDARVRLNLSDQK
jgi:hypothetical protein